jgi:polysaccharide biosynthesis protein PelF
LGDVERRKVVCILAEGSYPYVFGGVSSWVSQLVGKMPEVDFKIVSVMPQSDDKLEYKYEIQDNIIDIKTFFLQDYKKLNPLPKRREPKISKEEYETLRKFLRFDQSINWDHVVHSICNPKKLGNPIQFLHSKTFWNLLLEYYEEIAPSEGFNQFFWTIRSMFVFFITIMQNELPEADIYHSVSTGYPGLMGLIAKIKYEKSFLLTEHGIYAREREEDILKASWVQGIYKKMWIDFFYFISCGAYKAANKSISLFGRNREIQLSLGAIKENALVIPNGVSPEMYSMEREEHSTLNIGAILRVVPIKDVKTLIRAYKLVVKTMDNTRLYLMGPYEEDPEYYEECKKLVTVLGLEELIEFTGKVDIRTMVKKMDILILSSISEAQPLVILEGHSMGVPFISTDVGACKEMLEGPEGDTIGPSGIIVKPVSPKELAEAMITLLNDEELRVQMGLNGRKRVVESYTEAQFIESYKGLYDELYNELYVDGASTKKGRKKWLG